MEVKAEHSGGLTVEHVTDDELNKRIAEAERRLAAITNGADSPGGNSSIGTTRPGTTTDPGRPVVVDAQCGPDTGPLAESVDPLHS